MRVSLAAFIVSLSLAAPLSADVLYTTPTGGAPVRGAKAPAPTTAKANTFTLSQAHLITKVHAQTATAGAATQIRILRDGKAVYTETPRTSTGTNALAHPYLVFTPGTYTVEVDPPAAWRRTATGLGVVQVHGTPQFRPYAAAPVAATATASPKPFAITDALASAKIDPSRLRDNIKGKTEALGSGNAPGKSGGMTNTGMNRGLGGLGNANTNTTGGESKGPGSGASKAFEGLQGQGMAPSKYSDTFGGEAWNRGRTGSPDNFTGGGRGNASMDGDDADVYGMIVGMLTDAGGTVTGDPATDAAEAAYMMSVGSDGWEATKNMTSEERSNYWTQEQNRQMLGSDVRPRGDDNPSGGDFVVFGNANMRRAMTAFQTKAINARKGAAGGADREASGGSGVRMPSGRDDKPMRESNSGTINWDEVLKINELVNPQRQ